MKPVVQYHWRSICLKSLSDLVWQNTNLTYLSTTCLWVNICKENMDCVQMSLKYSTYRIPSSVKTAVFWVVVPCIVVYRHFRQAYSIIMAVGNAAKYFWNISKLLKYYMAQEPRSQPSSYLSPREPETSYCICELKTFVVFWLHQHLCFSLKTKTHTVSIFTASLHGTKTQMSSHHCCTNLKSHTTLSLYLPMGPVLHNPAITGNSLYSWVYCHHQHKFKFVCWEDCQSSVTLKKPNNYKAGRYFM
jgi:hypothetical protein